MKNIRSYDPIWMGILTGLATLSLWYFSSLAIDKTISPSADKVWPFFSAGIGAFFGSYFAYRFRKYEEKNSKLNKQKNAFDTCLFTLTRQYNAMFQMKKVLDQYQSNIERAFSMRAMKFPSYKDARIDFESLNFLTDASKTRHLLFLTIEQERFEQTILSMELKSSFDVEKVQPAFEEHKISGCQLDPEKLKETIGSLIYHSAINFTEVTYDLLCKNLDSNHEMRKKTWEIAKEHFPTKTFLSPEKIH
ncbi:hypothetical protein [Pseudomonas sp. IT-P395]|uniref:hypothetical protein n=1 Tax=Pseudomonas sp. IT-P395 TaxID=3026459 RepID=UPI0039E0FE85